MAEDYSIVEYYSSHEGYNCGYCNSKDTNYSHGMHAYQLTVQDYQDLIDRGWRRSGCFCYKPTNNRTCCPMYTIKCEALSISLTKSQKKIVKKMARFLRNELSKDETMDVNNDDRNVLDVNMDDAPQCKKYAEKARNESSRDLKVSSVHSDVNKQSNKLRKEYDPEKPGNGSESIASKSDFSTSSDARVSAPEKGPCRKAKLMRIERKRNKLLAQGKTLEEIEAMFRERKQRNKPKSFDQLFEESIAGTKKFEMKLVRVMSGEFTRTFSKSASLYKKYQMAIHRDPPGKCNEKSFFNFLVSSPLQHWKPSNGPPAGYGSFHEQYWLDDELIAIGVIDILPYCVSSVYFFYDPDYSYLSLGTFSAIREVYLTRQLSRLAVDLKYYYMGFYIHTCHKTRYKARLRPSKLLCTETNMWFDIEPCIKMLDKQKYCRFNNDISATDADGVVDIRKVLILYESIAMPYSVYKSRVIGGMTREEKAEIQEYASLVGSKCAPKILLHRRSSST